MEDPWRQRARTFLADPTNSAVGRPCAGLPQLHKFALLSLLLPPARLQRSWYIACAAQRFMETLHAIKRCDLPTPSFDYSTYTLVELFKERYWVDVRTEPSRIRELEQEIEKRCAHIRERATQTRFGPTSMIRFKPYGLISGVLVLLICTGPFVALEFLDLINLLSDAHADLLGLSGVWALLTLPLVIIAFVMGTVRDAERVVNWFDLAGR